MNIGDELTCSACGMIMTVDAFDLGDGEVFCVECGEVTEIEMDYNNRLEEGGINGDKKKA